MTWKCCDLMASVILTAIPFDDFCYIVNPGILDSLGKSRKVAVDPAENLPTPVCHKHCLILYDVDCKMVYALSTPQRASFITQDHESFNKNASLKVCKFSHFVGTVFTHRAYITHYERPPLKTILRGGLYRQVPLHITLVRVLHHRKQSITGPYEQANMNFMHTFDIKLKA